LRTKHVAPVSVAHLLLETLFYQVIFRKLHGLPAFLFLSLPTFIYDKTKLAKKRNAKASEKIANREESRTKNALQRIRGD